MKRIAVVLIIVLTVFLTSCESKYEGFRKLKTSWNKQELYTENGTCYPTDSVILFETEDAIYFSTTFYDEENCARGLYIENDSSDKLIEITNAFETGYVDKEAFLRTMLDEEIILEAIIKDGYSPGYLSYKGLMHFTKTAEAGLTCEDNEYTILYEDGTDIYMSYYFKRVNDCYFDMYFFEDGEYIPMKEMFSDFEEFNSYLDYYEITDKVHLAYNYQIPTNPIDIVLSTSWIDSKIVSDIGALIKMEIVNQINENMTFIEATEDINTSESLKVEIIVDNGTRYTFYVSNEMIIDKENNRMAYIDALEFKAYQLYYTNSILAAFYSEFFDGIDSSTKLTELDDGGPRDLDGTTVSRMLVVWDEEVVIGYAFLVEFYGFAGKVEYAIMVDDQGEIIEFNVIRHNETPGFGGNLETYIFKEMVENGSLEDIINGEFDIIAGATITSSTFTDSIEKINILIHTIFTEE